MNELVFKNKDQVVTSSRNIARDFDKKHREVLRAIDNIVSSGAVQDYTTLFHETNYVHEQNKQEYRQYLLNREGFTLVVMGFEGKQAIKFKVDYMNAFKKMEKELSKPLNNTKLLLETALEHEKKIETIESDVSMLKDTMRIDGRQEHKLQKTGRGKVVKVLGGKNAAAYKEISRSVFQMFWNEFKDYFMIPRYNELPKKDFDEAISFIGAWQPKTGTRLKIDAINKQMTIDDAS